MDYHTRLFKWWVGKSKPLCLHAKMKLAGRVGTEVFNKPEKSQMKILNCLMNLCKNNLFKLNYIIYPETKMYSML